MEQLKSGIRQKQRLPVAVFTTPAAEAVLGRSGLSIVDLLRPVSLVNKLNVPMRVGEYSTRVQEVQLALYQGSSMFQPAPELIDERLQQLLDVEAQRHAQLQPLGNIVKHVQQGPAESINPWFAACSAEFLRLLQFTDHETLDHPVAGLFCMPADTTSVLQVTEKLMQPESPLPLAASEVMLPIRDPMIAKHFVLVQDATCMEDARALQNLATLSNTYGAANCSLLKLYGGGPPAAGAAAAADLPPAVFQACRHACMPKGGAGEPVSRPQEPPTGLGARLTAEDMAAAGQLLRDVAERSVLPKLEERMARLNLGITAARKGLKNRLSRLWKGAAGEAGPAQEAPYPWHSVEGQMRSLADLAFMLGQLEFAVAMYRLAAQDYLAAPNSKWYAGAEEMIGLCSILAQDPAVDPVKYLNRAFEHYSKLRGRQALMLATRVMMTAAAYQAALGRRLAANNSLMRAHFYEENTRAALLLEAAAYELMRCSPPCTRKAAFHLVLAGLRYHSARQQRLAVHCYMQVTELYANSSWQHINQHLHEVLGRQCVELADGAGMLRHHTALLDSAHRPAAAQQHYLNQFLDTVKAQGVTGVIPNLPLPVVMNDTATVQFADMRCYASAAAATAAAGKAGDGSGSSSSSSSAEGSSSPAAAWSQLEQLVAGGNMPSTNWLEGAKQVHDGEEFNTVAAGEDVVVQVTFRNPLQIKLGLSRVRLHVTFTPADKPGVPADAGTGAAAGAPAAAAAAAAAAAPAAPGGGGSEAAPSPEHVLVTEAQFSLHPGEVLCERLSVRPLTAGWLRVLGVSWTLAGTAEGYVGFDLKGRHRKRPKGDRPSQQKHYPPSRRLLFHVLKGMPRLELGVSGLPTTAAAGELLRVQVTLRNVGLVPARNLKAAISSPQVALGAAVVAPAGSTAAAVAAGGAADVWCALQAGTDVITLARQRALHRRHQSSGAALTGAAHERTQQAAPAAIAPAAPPVAAAAAAAAHLQHSSGPQHDHLPHIHSSPSIAATAAAAPGLGAAAIAATGSSRRVGWHEQQGAAAAAAAAAGGAGAGAGPSAGVFSFAEPDLVLEPGQSVVVPMWLHLQKAGQFEFQCVWFCEPLVLVSAAMRYRVLLSHHVLEVSPLLELSPAVSPSAVDLLSYTLRLEATYSKSKDAARGQLHLQQVSCLTEGLDGGWRLTPFTSSSSSSSAPAAATPATPAAALQQSLTPGIALSAGESTMQYLQLLSPAACVAAGTRAGSSASTAALIPLQQGPLHYFYSRCRLGALQQQQQAPHKLALAGAQGAASSDGSTAATAADGSSAGPAAASGLRGIALDYKHSQALVAEPPVDLLLLWRFQPAAAGMPGAPANPQQQQQQQQRVGLLTFYDLCAAQRLNPVRMMLEGPTLLNPGQAGSHGHGSSRASLRHDFRAASMCVVPLRLKLRNCGVVAVAVTVRVCDAWEGLARDHAWTCTAAPAGGRPQGLQGAVVQPQSAVGAGAAAGGGGSSSSSPLHHGRMPGPPPPAAAAGGAVPYGGQPFGQQPAGAAAAGPASAGNLPGPPPPAAAAVGAADGALPPKPRTPPTSTGGGNSSSGALGPAADGLGLGGFSLGALAGGLASGLRFPSPGGASGSEEAGGGSGTSLQAASAAAGASGPISGALLGGLGLFPASGSPAAGGGSGGITPVPAVATAVSSTGTPKGGVSPRQGQAAGFSGAPQAAGFSGGPQAQPGLQDSAGTQQRRPQQQQQQQVEVQGGLPPGPDHVWCGATRVTLEALQPGDSAEVALQVAVFRPGVYVIDDYVVDWQVVEGAAGARRRQGSKVGEPTVLRVEAV